MSRLTIRPELVALYRQGEMTLRALSVVIGATPDAAFHALVADALEGRASAYEHAQARHYWQYSPPTSPGEASCLSTYTYDGGNGYLRDLGSVTGFCANMTYDAVRPTDAFTLAPCPTPLLPGPDADAPVVVPAPPAK